MNKNHMSFEKFLTEKLDDEPIAIPDCILVSEETKEDLTKEEIVENLTENYVINESELEILNEVKFSEPKLEKVVKLYARIMGKKMGGDFRKLGTEDFKRASGIGKGIRYMNKSGNQLRFNWDQNLAAKSKFMLTSVDYWESSNKNFQHPSRTINLGPQLNVVEVLDVIIKALKSGQIRESVEEVMVDVLNEKRTGDEKRQWLTSKGLPKSLAGSEAGMRKRAANIGLLGELDVFLGNAETNSFEGDLQEIEQQFTTEVYADPDTVFDDIEDLLSLVASGSWRTLIVCGMGGVGKTYHITEGPRSLKKLLGAPGGKWEYHSGTKAAPMSFYRTLFSERDKIIVFDEADSLLKNDDIVMMLKPILDTSGDNMASYMSNTENMVGRSKKEIIEYSAEIDDLIASGARIGVGKDDAKMPSKFYFTGGMIFISNMPASKIEGAIMSRSIFVDVHLAEQDVLKRIESIARAQAKGDPQTSDEDVDMIMAALGGGSAKGPTHQVTYMTPELARKNKTMTVRAYALANTMRKAGLENWANLAAMYA